MGYYASGDGFVEYKFPLSDGQREAIEDAFDMTGYSFEFDGNRKLEIWCSDKYFYDTEDLLNSLAEIAQVLDGSMEFCGEDYEHWRFVYDDKANDFRYEVGHVFFEGDLEKSYTKRIEYPEELIDVIISSFDGFLKSKGITIPGEEDDYSSDNAALNGENYDVLQSGLEAILHEWNLF